MIKNYASIQLFKRNRETDEPLIKEDLPNTEQQVPELIIRPLGSKEKEIPLLTDSSKSPFPLRITKAIQKALEILGTDRKDKF